MVLNGTPDNYEHWLSSILDLVQRAGGKDPLVFINAWNEWAEGCHLEPDRRCGRGFPDATRNATSGLRRFPAFPDTVRPQADQLRVDQKQLRTFWADIGEAVNYHLLLRFGALKLAVNRRPWLKSLLLPVIRTMCGLRHRLGGGVR